jgi:hypothetical protein
MNNWRVRLHEGWEELADRWREWRNERRANRQLRRELRAQRQEELHLARVWASSNLVVEARRHNELMLELVNLARTFLQPTGQDAGRGDNYPVEVDEQTDIDELRQRLEDEQLARIERGEAPSENENENEGNGDLIDRVEDQL